MFLLLASIVTFITLSGIVLIIEVSFPIGIVVLMLGFAQFLMVIAIQESIERGVKMLMLQGEYQGE